MTRPAHLLLLAGSGEGRVLASALAKMPMRVTASLVQPDHWSGPLPVPTRAGGFGGAAGFAEFLDAEHITAVLDATHPFAARISERSYEMCRERGIPYLALDRDEWTPGAGDQWTCVDTADEAAELTHPGSRVFVTTGRETLAAFTDLPDCHFFFRRLAASGPASEAPGITYVYGVGPFSVEDEVATLRALNIDLLICKNAGGTLSRTKLDAARELGLPVILLRRPQPTGAPSVQSVEDALDWVNATCL